MSTGKRASSVFAVFGIDTSAAVDGLAKLAKSTEKTLKQIEATGNKLGGIGMAIAGSIGAAVAVGAQHNDKLKASVDSIQDSFARAATSIATAFQPTIDAIAEKVQGLAQWLDGLDPGLKETIANVAAFAAGGLMLVGMIGKLAGGLGSIISLARTLAPIFAGIGVPLLAIIAIIGGVVAVGLVLHRAWRKNWGGIQEITGGVVNKISEWFQGFKNFMLDIWKALMDAAGRWINSVLDGVDTLQKVLKKFGYTGPLIDTEAMREGFKGLIDDLKSGKAFTAAVDFAKDVGGSIADATMEEIKLITEEVKAKLASLSDSKGNSGYRASTKDIEAGVRAELARQKKEAELTAKYMQNQELRNTIDANNNAAIEEAGMQLAATLEKIAQEEADVARAIENWTYKNVGAGSLSKDPDMAKWFKSQGVGIKKDKEVDLRLKNLPGLIVGTVTTALGEVGSIINSAIQGMQTAGPWGALIAVIMELVSRMDSFNALIDTAMDTLGSAVALIEVVFKPIFEVLKAFTGWVDNIQTDILKSADPEAYSKLMRSRQDKALEENTKATKENSGILRGSINMPSGRWSQPTALGGATYYIQTVQVTSMSDMTPSQWENVPRYGTRWPRIKP
jgi:hypothetical protein